MIVVFSRLVKIMHEGALLRGRQSKERVGNTGTEAALGSQHFPSPHAVCIRNGKRRAEGVSHLLLAEMAIESPF